MPRDTLLSIARLRRAPSAFTPLVATLLVALALLTPAPRAAAQAEGIGGAADEVASRPVAASPAGDPPASSAAEAISEARRRLADHDLDGAIAALAPFAGDPAAPDSLLALLAGLYVEDGRPADALALLAPRIDPADGGPELGAADGELLFAAARAAQALGRPAEAEAYLERAAARAPLSRAAVLLAALRSEQGHPEAAAELLRPIVEGPGFAGVVAADPLFAGEIAFHYGRTLAELGRGEEAVPHLRRAAELAPEEADRWRRLGEVLVELGRIDEARVALTRAQELDTAAHDAAVARAADRERAEELVRQALALHDQGRVEDSLAALREASRLAPGDPRPAMLEVRLLVSLGRGSEAFSRADELVRLAPASADAWQIRGMARLVAGESVAAESDLRHALAIDPDHQEALNGLAMTLLRTDRPAEAAQLLERLLARRPDDERARHNLARAREQLGRDSG